MELDVERHGAAPHGAAGGGHQHADLRAGEAGQGTSSRYSDTKSGGQLESQKNGSAWRRWAPGAGQSELQATAY